MKSILNNGKLPSEKADTVDLDVTPVMNMFVILIPFLVSMAVFTHYSVLEFGLPPNAGMAGGGPSKADLKLTLVMGSAGFELVVGDSLMDSVSLGGNNGGLSGLESSLARVRAGLNRKDEVVVAVNDGIVFDKVVRVMDLCRKTGFEKVALAEGPNQADSES
jgi:biopolymer transport protein ExbD